MRKATTTLFSAATIALVLGASPVFTQTAEVEQTANIATVSYVHVSNASGGNL